MIPGPQNLARHVHRDRARRWASRAEFAAAAGVGKRTVDRIETADGVGRYRLDIKQRIEAALDWMDGSFDRVLAGGRPGYVLDPELAELVRAWPTLPPRIKRRVLRVVRETSGR